jgi:hypothetical protein
MLPEPFEVQDSPVLHAGQGGLRFGVERHKAAIAEAIFLAFALLLRRRPFYQVYNETEPILDRGCFPGLESTQNRLG